MQGTRTRILKKYNRRRSKRYSKKSKRHTRKNVYSKTYKKIQKGGFLCDKEKKELEVLRATNGGVIEELKKELTASKKELTILKDTLKGLSEQNTELLKKSKKDVTSSPAYLDMEKNVKLYEERNKNLTDEVKKLKNENYNLATKLEKLTKQKMPTEEEIDAVILEETDKEKIDKILNEWYSGYMKMAGNSKGEMGQHDTHIMDIEVYKNESRKQATDEYKKIKLMGENSES